MVEGDFTRRSALGGMVGAAAGAAATSVAELIAPKSSAVRTADGHIYEAVDPSTPPFHETTHPNGYHLKTTGGVKLRLKAASFVTPELLNGDLHMAAAYAAVFKVKLMTGPVEYEITSAFVPHDITWVSDNTRIKQMATLGGVAVMRPQNNVKHIGRTYLYLPDREPPNTANRAHVVFGNWATGAPLENFHFDEFVLEGGHEDCNGFSVAGGCHNVRGRRVKAAPRSRIGRLFLAHWANFQDHYNSGGTYQHAPEATPTTHPHDIVIDEVVGDLEVASSDFCALWAVSAGYNIRARRVSGRCVNNGSGPGELVLLTAGDLGFAYATPEELASGMWGLTVGKVNGSCSHTAVRRIGRALYYNADATPQPTENYFAKIQETVGEVDAYNTIGNASYCGVDGHNGYGRSLYRSIKARNFKSALNCSNYNQDITADSIEAIDNQNQAIQLAGSGSTEADWPKNIKIGILRVNGTGLSESTADASTVSNVNKIIGLSINTIMVDKLKDMETFTSPALRIGADVRNITIDNVILNWVGNKQVAAVANAAAKDRSVEIGHIRSPRTLTPVSGA